MDKITNDELLREMKRRAQEGRLSIEKVAGEMGIKLEDTEKVKALEAGKAELESWHKAAGEMGMKLDEALSVAKKAKEAEKQAAEQKAFGEMIDAVKAEKGLLKDGKPVGEMAAMVDKFARLEVGMSREQVAGEMEKVINDPDIKRMLASKAGSTPVGEIGSKAGATERKVYEI